MFNHTTTKIQMYQSSKRSIILQIGAILSLNFISYSMPAGAKPVPIRDEDGKQVAGPNNEWEFFIRDGYWSVPFHWRSIIMQQKM